MKQEIADYLHGQVEAMRKLAIVVRNELDLHCPAAAREFRECEYTCNRAIHVIGEQVKGGKG